MNTNLKHNATLGLLFVLSVLSMHTAPVLTTILLVVLSSMHYEVLLVALQKLYTWVKTVAYPVVKAKIAEIKKALNL